MARGWAGAYPPPPTLGPFTQDVGSSWWQACSGVLAAAEPEPVARLLGQLNRLVVSAEGLPLGAHPFSPHLLTRLKAVVGALRQNRQTDAQTLLRTALRTDPHNPFVLFMLSQLGYLASLQGSVGQLPEARDAAQKACLAHDRTPPAMLAEFILFAAAAEARHDPMRAAEWLLASPLTATSGLPATPTFGLLAWALLAQMCVSQDAHLAPSNLLPRLVPYAMQVPGGGLIYAAWFGPWLAAVAPTPERVQVHHYLNQVLGRHTALAQHMPGATLHDEQGRPWLVRNRYLQAFRQVGAVPGPDHTLLHLALDGSSWLHKTTPDRQLSRAWPELKTGYWQQWAQAVASHQETRPSPALPWAETGLDAPLLSLSATLLNSLKQAEDALINAPLWDAIQPWLPTWTTEHLLTVSTGSNKARLRFAPTLMPFSALYRVWNPVSMAYHRPSEVIAKTAEHGGFGSFFEVQAAIHGASVLLHDSQHGLVALQRRALAAAKQADPVKFARFSPPSTSSNWLAIVPIMLLAGTVAAFTMAANLGQALGLVLAMFGLTGTVLVLTLGRPGTP